MNLTKSEKIKLLINNKNNLLELLKLFNEIDFIEFSDDEIIEIIGFDKFYYFENLDNQAKIFKVNTIFNNLDEILFSFDKQIIYNYWKDYPNNLTVEEIDLVDKFILPFRK